jgi:hypothetical protein
MLKFLCVHLAHLDCVDVLQEEQCFGMGTFQGEVAKAGRGALLDRGGITLPPHLPDFSSPFLCSLSLSSQLFFYWLLACSLSSSLA